MRKDLFPAGMISPLHSYDHDGGRVHLQVQVHVHDGGHGHDGEHGSDGGHGVGVQCTDYRHFLPPEAAEEPLASHSTYFSGQD